MTDNPVLETAEKFYNDNPAESELDKPANEADVTQEQEPEQEVELAKQDDDKTESEELEAQGEVKESLFIELDGEEIDLDDVKKWRDGHLMQSDYTKKTTTLAEERKTFEADRKSQSENLLKAKTEVSEMKDLLQVLVTEDEVIDWAELKVDDPDRYIELKEKADKRKEALEKVKSEQNQSFDDPAIIADEQRKLFTANPEWLDADNKPTDTYTKDIKLMNDYAISAGFTSDEFARMTRAHHMVTVLKAAKYDALQEKGRSIKEKREKVPVIARPKAKEKTTQPKSAADVFYGKTG